MIIIGNLNLKFKFEDINLFGVPLPSKSQAYNYKLRPRKTNPYELNKRLRKIQVKC